MNITAGASKAIERYRGEAPFLCKLIATSLMIEEARLANDFGRILEGIEQQLSALSIWQ